MCLVPLGTTFTFTVCFEGYISYIQAASRMNTSAHIVDVSNFIQRKILLPPYDVGGLYGWLGQPEQKSYKDGGENIKTASTLIYDDLF